MWCLSSFFFTFVSINFTPLAQRCILRTEKLLSLTHVKGLITSHQETLLAESAIDDHPKSVGFFDRPFVCFAFLSFSILSPNRPFVQSCQSLTRVWVAIEETLASAAAFHPTRTFPSIQISSAARCGLTTFPSKEEFDRLYPIGAPPPPAPGALDQPAAFQQVVVLLYCCITASTLRPDCP